MKNTKSVEFPPPTFEIVWYFDFEGNCFTFYFTKAESPKPSHTP